MTAYDTAAQAVDQAVRSALHRELWAQGLLLTDAEAGVALAEQRQRGAVLLGDLLAHCYGMPAGQPVTVQFGGEADADRVELALAFGELVGRLLDPPGDAGHGSTDLLCATFNLGIGLVDGLCDRTPTLGLALLETIAACDLRAGVREGWQPGRLSLALNESLRADPAAAFAARVVEAVLELVHESYPGSVGLTIRNQVGTLLANALDAEQRSIAQPMGLDRLDLVECSRRTSVVPFRIIEQLASGDPQPAQQSPGTLLGEAMWRVDDLVDLMPDIRQGALNAVLLEAVPDADLASASDVAEQVLGSGRIPGVAAQAAALLRDGLADVGTGVDRQSFLAFVQTYAGLDPVAALPAGP